MFIRLFCMMYLFIFDLETIFAAKPDFEQHLLKWEVTSQTILFLLLSALARKFNDTQENKINEEVNRYFFATVDDQLTFQLFQDKI